MKHVTTGRKKRGRWQRQPGRVPTYEECLMFILDSIHYDSGNTKRQCVSATNKRRLRQFDHDPGSLGVGAYQDIVRDIMDQYSSGLQDLGKRHADIFEDELKAFLRRFENLLLSLTIGRADARQVRWSLCVRFFVPWVALRIAFGLRHKASDQFKTGPHWFLPSMTDRRIGSCFVRVIDREVQKSGETGAALTLRLCGHSTAGDRTNLAQSLGRDFRRYRAMNGTASDLTVNTILKACSETPDLQAKLVVARAIDRVVQAAIKSFGTNHALKLLRFFRLTFGHFRQMLSGLDAELPKDDERAWLFLQSRTFTGNTPFDSERCHPLTDPYLHELGRRISTELQNADKTGRLARVPTTGAAFGKGRFDFQFGDPLPDEIHEAVRKSDFAAALRVSQSLFTSESKNVADAVRIGELFADMGLSACDPLAVHNILTPPTTYAPQVLDEAARLLGLAHEQAAASKKAPHAIRYLRFLLTPHRPKSKAERPLARKLYRVAANYYLASGHGGSSMFLLGCLLWLEGNEKRAMRAFLKAAKSGRATFEGHDWIKLLEYGPVLANKISNKRALRRFLKVSELEGVLHREPTMRTNFLEKKLRTHGEVAKFQFAFVPFPA